MGAFVYPRQFVRNAVISRRSFQRQLERPVRRSATAARAGSRAAAKGRKRSNELMRSCYRNISLCPCGSTVEARGRGLLRLLAKFGVGSMWGGGFKPRKMRRIAQFRGVVHGSFGTTHNLKVTGSNPVPATKYKHDIKTLQAAHGAAFCVGFSRSTIGQQKHQNRGDSSRIVVRQDADRSKTA